MCLSSYLYLWMFCLKYRAQMMLLLSFLALLLGTVAAQDATNTIWPIPKTFSASGAEFPVSRAFTIDTESSSSGTVKRGAVRYLEIISRILAQGDKSPRYRRSNEAASLAKVVVVVEQDNDTVLDNTTDYSYKLSFQAGSRTPETAFIFAKSPFGAL